MPACCPTLCLLWLAAPPLGRMSRIKEGASTLACISNQKLGSLCRHNKSRESLPRIVICKGTVRSIRPGCKTFKKKCKTRFLLIREWLECKICYYSEFEWIDYMCAKKKPASSKPALWGKATGNDYGDSGGRACVAPCAS